MLNNKKITYNLPFFITLLFSVSGGVRADIEDCADRVNNTPEKLLECVTVDGVSAHLQALQAIADANDGTRANGTPGFDASKDYVVQKLTEAGYVVTVQDFVAEGFIELPSTLEQTSPPPQSYVQGQDFRVMSFSPSGDVTAQVTAVDLDLGLGNSSSSGCEAADFAGFPAGNIALIQRGGSGCTFQLKAENAAAAGASGVIIFNQGNTEGREGLFSGTLSADYMGGIPVVGTTYDLGVTLATLISEVTIHMDIYGIINPQSYNVIAETKDGDPNNVVVAGAHLDSVAFGPGIQDNGSASAALLETAIYMAKVKTKNKVRFAWWGAHEVALQGSQAYLNSLSAADKSKIALYLDFHMIASPNYVYFVLDGDDSSGTSIIAGVPGSGAIEDVFKRFYGNRLKPYKELGLDGSSDYFAFSIEDIPIGGIFAGATGIKTPEEEQIFGGTAGEQYDPCYHLACDTFDNVNQQALDLNSDAVAYSVLSFSMNTKAVNGVKGKGNFKQNSTPAVIPFSEALTE